LCAKDTRFFLCRLRDAKARNGGRKLSWPNPRYFPNIRVLVTRWRPSNRPQTRTAFHHWKHLGLTWPSLFYLWRMAQHSIDSLYLGGMARFYRVAYLGQGLNVRDEGPSCDVSRHTAAISFEILWRLAW